MKKFLVAAVAVAAMAASSAMGAPAEKVWVCHNTGSETNPVVLVYVSVNATKMGHLGPKSHHQEAGFDSLAGDQTRAFATCPPQDDGLARRQQAALKDRRAREAGPSSWTRS